MSKAKYVRNLVLGGLITVSGLSAIAAVNLTTFAPNTPIKSSEVNANFSSLKAMIEEPIGVSKLVVSGNAADGKVLKLEAGGLAWGDDRTGGSGGTAYSASGGLSLAGTTFSLADGGVTKAKLSATGGADGKVLKLQGGNLVWSDDIAGSAGSTYSADGSSLTLEGTKFSVKDGGIGESKIADGAVTSDKLKLPLFLTGNKTAGQGAEFVVTNQGSSAIQGTSKSGLGVYGTSTSGFGVFGTSDSARGISGYSTSGLGVFGESNGGRGVVGYSTSKEGVVGESHSGPGVSGTSDKADGVRGISNGDFSGVYGQSASGPGVYGASGDAPALIGKNNGNTETLQLIQAGNGALIDARGAGGVTAFSVDRFGNVFSKSNSYTSDRNAKTNFSSVDVVSVLERVTAMPVTRWNYKQDSQATQHIGPMAQDFHAAFGLNGSDDKHINAVDVQGVALAAIQGLNQKLETENQELKARLSALERQFASFKAMQPKPSTTRR